jgi:cobalt-zinc-cadmium efflux system outer membrane protein
MLFLAGCASVQRTAQLPAVEQPIAERLGEKVRWHQTADDERQALELVRALLKEPLTADSAVQVALLNNHGLQAAYERLGIAQADLVQAGLIDNPTLSLQYLFGDGDDIIEASILQQFIGVFTLSARKKIGAASARQATLEVAQTVTDTAAQVRLAYFAVVADAQALELWHQVTLAMEAAAELTGRQYRAGTLARRDQAVQQAFYAQLVAEAARAEAQLAASREKLNRLLGLSGELTAWRIPERLPDLPSHLPGLEGIERAAISQRLDLAAASAQVEALARSAGLTRSTRWLSMLGIGVTYKREGDEDFIGPDVELMLPLFDTGQARVTAADGELRAAERRLEQLAVDIRSRARAARLRLDAAFQLAQHYRDALLPVQQVVVDETLKFYNGMLVGVYDLLLARQQQIQAAREYVATLEEFWLAWAELEHIAGGRVPLAMAAEPLPHSSSNGAANPGASHGEHHR